MDKKRRDGVHGKSSAPSPWASDPSLEAWHSTPVKNNAGALFPDVSKVSFQSSNEMNEMARQLARSVPPISNDIHGHTQLQQTQMSLVRDMESSTIQRQRRELQLLITELKDRDRELNTMASSHHKQLHAWEQDRQRVLGLEKRCARSDAELQKRVEMIRALTLRVLVVEARETDLQTELGTTQQQLQKLGQAHQDMETSHDLQDKNDSLTSTVLALSSQVGSLQVREEELSSMLKLKDKDVSEAAAHTADLTGRLQDQEATLKESNSRENRLLRDVEETTRRYREYRHENASLWEELQQHVTQSSAQREEIIRLKQENQMLCRDLALSGEGDSWKDELLALARSKQERSASELHCLRQVCENQQNDLQLLQLNLETSREALEETRRQETVGREDTVRESQNVLEIYREQQQPPSSQIVVAGYRRGTIGYRRTPGGKTQTGYTAVGEPEPGEGDDAQADVGRGPGMNLVAVFRNAPLGASTSPVLSLEVRPRTPQDHDRRTCQDDSLRIRNCCLASDANQPATAEEDPELLSQASNDGRRPVVSCCLRRVLDDSTHSCVASLECSGLNNTGSAKNRAVLASRNLSHDSGSKKEQFGKQQLHSITKTLTSAETPLKEKYARNIILGSHKEGGASTFMSYCQNLPLSSSSIVSWKYCYMLHKVLRDGHPNAVRDCNRYSRNIRDMGTLWGTLHDRYGHIVALSAKFLCLKMDFHVKHKPIPANLEASDETLEKEAGSDMNKVLDMTQELLDYLDTGLKFAETVLRQVDSIGAKTTTPSGQCRLAPLIPLILDCSFLYHFSVILLFKLHGRITPDALLGHRERFRDQFTSLSQFFTRAREIEFFKTIIQIPDLPDSPPNFLRAGAFAEYKRPVVIVGNQGEEEEAEPKAEVRDTPQNQQYYLVNQYEGQEKRETETLRKELEVLKPELHLIKTEAQRCVMELKGQVNRLEAQLEDQTNHRQMALVDNELLRMEVETLRGATAANAGAHLGYKEADTRAHAVEMRFSQLKERHAELVTSHADLMKQNTETVRILSGMKQDKDDMLISKQQVYNDLDSLRLDNKAQMEKQQQENEQLRKAMMAQTAELAHLRGALGQKDMEGSQLSGTLAGLQSERDVLHRATSDKDAELSSLRQQVHSLQSSLDQERERHNRELEALRAQLQQQLAINASHASTALQTKEMAGSQLSGTLAGLQAEREVLLRSARERDSELSSLRQQAQLQQSSLDQHRHMSSMELGSLQAQLQQQACREGELTRKLQDEQFCLLQCAVVEAEGIILDAMDKIDDPVHVRCTSSPDYLVSRAEVTLGSIDKMHQSKLVYVGNMNDASGLLRAVTQFSHLAADTIVTGAATSHSAPTDHADRLTEGCRDCSTHCLQFLKELKLQSTLPRADPAAMHYAVQRILALGQELQPRGRDVLKEEMGDMVDKEMLATSTAIEEAVLRMDEILSQARRETTGIKLEVNQSILGSCSDLMKAIHMLVTAATDLQKDIVESGRGAASVDEFYAKNSRWTEGLISASKAVGWGATQILESADRVVSADGKYEEIIACSHEIAASTAQLVASSKVKADRNNKKLVTLQQASRHVNDMTAVVVTSTKHGQQQITDKTPMDFSGRSLIKLKKMEMDSQVKVLELENQLEQERVRLGELRKKHYQMGERGAADRGGESVEDGDGADSFPPPPPPTLLPEVPYAPAQPYLSTATATASSTTQGSTNSSNPFLQPQTLPPFPAPPPSSSSPSSLSSTTTSSTPHLTSQSYTPAPQPSPSGQTPYTPYTPPAQSYTPSAKPYTPSTQSYTPSVQPYTPSVQPYTPSVQPYTPSVQPYTPSVQPYTPSTQSYTPSAGPYLPSSYTPNQSFPQSAVGAALNPSYSNPQAYFPSQHPAPTSNIPASAPNPAQKPNSSSSSKSQGSPAPSRKSNIFTKSGNLLKSAVS
ncbi:hypothetical protein NHX12_026887 [Muraenolepis orangiensis]|uniref:Huntingtin-interacting protein 1-related protein-like n=1 Tax=Muraenolepis orangiensis TaxID=630683 RepID=A0A9Q0EGB3_9TELE|nr:hypothetical protein NHX12_026887 [Muraenolepis orangiensis]